VYLDDQDRDTRAGLSLFVGRSLPSDLFDLAGSHGLSVGGWTYRWVTADPDDQWNAERLCRLGRNVREAATARQIRMLVPGDPGWPAETGCDELPCLWVRGNADLAGLLGKAVAITGASDATGEGARLAARLASGLADTGCSIITTTDAGIDAQVTNTVLHLPAAVPLLVTGGGLDPASSPAIAVNLPPVLEQGAVISAAPPGARPYRARVQARNELLYRLGVASVLVEARAGSNRVRAARHAARTGRVLCAVPGNLDAPMSQGCQMLIREGAARPVDSVPAVLAALDRRRAHADDPIAVQGPALAA
jgi:predicted Rossmann fold nucleotide-binding protein DprA/Smf involved in DNA uptake